MIANAQAASNQSRFLVRSQDELTPPTSKPNSTESRNTRSTWESTKQLFGILREYISNWFSRKDFQETNNTESHDVDDLNLQRPILVNEPQDNDPASTPAESDPFSLAEKMRLYDIRDKLLKAFLVTKLNSEVLAQIKEYYDGFRDIPKFNRWSQDLLDFSTKIRSIESKLSIRQKQLEGLMSLQLDGKALISFVCRHFLMRMTTRE